MRRVFSEVHCHPNWCRVSTHVRSKTAPDRMVHEEIGIHEKNKFLLTGRGVLSPIIML